MKKIVIQRYSIEGDFTEEKLQNLVACVEKELAHDKKTHVALLLGANYDHTLAMKSGLSKVNAEPDGTAKDLLYAGSRQYSAALVYSVLQNAGLEPQLVDASRLGYTLLRKNPRTSIRKLTAGKLKRTILSKPVTVLYVSKNVNPEKSMRVYLESSYFCITLATALGQKKCHYYLDQDKFFENFGEFYSGERNLRQMAYREFSDLLSFHRSRNLKPGAINYAYKSNVEIEMCDLNSTQTFLHVTHFRNLTEKSFHFSETHSDIEWVTVTYDASSNKGKSSGKWQDLFFSVFAESKIDFRYLQDSHNEKGEETISFLVHRSQKEEFSMILDYNGDSLKNLRIDTDNLYGLINFYGDFETSLTRYVYMIGKVLRGKSYKFEMLFTGSNRITILVHIDRMKEIAKMFQQEFVEE